MRKSPSSKSPVFRSQAAARSSPLRHQKKIVRRQSPSRPAKNNPVKRSIQAMAETSADNTPFLTNIIIDNFKQTIEKASALGDIPKIDEANQDADPEEETKNAADSSSL